MIPSAAPYIASRPLNALKQQRKRSQDRFFCACDLVKTSPVALDAAELGDKCHDRRLLTRR